jgi:quinol monooxygenase YgiN
MSEVVEFTLHVKPGHYDQVLKIETDFVTSYMDINPNLKSVIVVGDAAAGVLRAIGTYDTAEHAAAVNSDPVFARFNDQLAPYIVGAAERVRLDLIHSWNRD